MKKHWITYLALISLFVLAIMVPIAGAFDNYAGGCDGCHGAFPGTAPYVSQHDGVAWKNPGTGANLNLHDGHRTYMLGGSTSPCNICHSGSSRTPVYLNSSAGGVTGFAAISCTGCHDGDGLRAHHENSGAYPCYDCHSQGTPPAENVKPPYYFSPDTAHPNKPTDPCNLNGSESAVAPLSGLDNDGNLLYDQNDPACAVAAAKISLSPTSLTFGSQAAGSTSVAQTVTISNTGAASLSVTGITNSNTTDFTVTAPSTPFSVAAGGSQTFSLVFAPGTTGAKSATITVASNAGNPTVSASGTGTLPSLPVLGVSPMSLAFGNQTIGTTSAAKTVTISNTGTATLNVTGITSSNAEFAVSPSTVSPIAPGGSATLSITFTPAASGSRSANISILSNGGNATVSATGTGVTAGALSASPATLTYAGQTVGTTSATQTVTISNTGGTALTVNSITNSNTTDFVLAAPATPLTINGGASQTFTVAFKPAASGSKTATLTVASTAGNATVSATGTGAAVVTQPVLSVSPLSLTYSSVIVNTSATKTVTISNTGNAPLNITNISKTGSAAFSFSPASFTSIAAGSSATLTVTYAPTVVGTDTGATINITSDGGSATVTLAGTAVQQTQTETGDVALVKLSVPSAVTVKVGQALGINVLAGATTTNNEADASVTLNTASDSRVTVSLDHTSVTKEIESGTTTPQTFGFGAKISCTKKGTWPVTWTAKISAASNSNTSNDTLKGTTLVTCTVGNSGGRTSSDR